MTPNPVLAHELATLRLEDLHREAHLHQQAKLAGRRGLSFRLPLPLTDWTLTFSLTRPA